MRRIDRFRSGKTEERFDLSALAQQIHDQMMFGGHTYPLTGIETTYGKRTEEKIGNSFTGFSQAAYKSDGPVFTAVSTRQRLLSEIRFQYQVVIPRPGQLVGGRDLSILERPWENGTTGDLVTKMEAHDSLAGNAYVWRNRRKNRLHCLRPDWTTVIIGSHDDDPERNVTADDLDADLLGYVYQPGGMGSGKAPIFLMPEDVAHWAPIPDPEASYRGMSWISPVLSEVMADKSATAHVLQFFENAATPNLAIKYPREVTPDQLKLYLDLLDEDHAGAANAYKTLHIGGGADPMVIGTDLKQLDFRAVRGAGETRIASASGIPALIHGFAEGLDAATYSNFGQARRLTGDGFLRPTWRSLCGALASIVDVPGDSRLWYDASDNSFLQEDEADAAAILKEQALTVESLIRSGFTPESSAAAVAAGDLTGLQHTGLYSVQLQAPGAGQPAPPAA